MASRGVMKRLKSLLKRQRTEGQVESITFYFRSAEEVDELIKNLEMAIERKKWLEKWDRRFDQATSRRKSRG